MLHYIISTNEISYESTQSLYSQFRDVHLAMHCYETNACMCILPKHVVCEET